MHGFLLFAQPWWVNLLILVPVASYACFRKGLALPVSTLVVTAVFGTAMGFVESAVVVYLRAALGMLPGSSLTPSAAQVLNAFANRLSAIEMVREAATIVMLVCVALLAAKTRRERWAIFLWTFAFWDVIYYLGLRVTIGWPSTLTTQDVLFLLPSPWFAEVWFPILVSGLCMVAVVAGKVSWSPNRVIGMQSSAEPSAGQ